MEQDNIELKPAMIFAFCKTLPLVLLAVAFLLLAWYLSPYFIGFSFVTACFAWYRMLYIRNICYLLTPEIVRVSRGIFFKRVDQLELFRVKDYIITQSFLLQIFKIMNLTLKSTDPENPILLLRGIPASAIVDKIRERVNEARNRNKIYELN